ncbi:MAG: hypothetical protein ACO1OQ_07040 [Rufibacter sp.]
MKAKAILFTLALGLGLFTACDRTSELFEVEMALPVSETKNFPTTVVEVDTAITLQALFQPSNGCGRNSRLDTATVDNTFTLKYYVKYPEPGSDVICTDVAKPLYYTIRFNPQKEGTYQFRFWRSGTDDYLTKSIEVVPRKK